ncbi:upf0394 inner membrane protein YeeE [Anaeramoeba ignava]|uniref:Upf0394 inner membrane protein YeeE n=1 Tax=Anaeramoeba ignava TaxID=1746090 RepID=A0A9Q0REQ2_ANAIG|nr:upf0394 inner membrane protein YeeE [Anaeramoeba ignava]
MNKSILHPPTPNLSQQLKQYPLAVKLAAVIYSGFAFGIGLSKGYLFHPHAFVAQFHLKSFILMRVFLSALATAAFVKGVISLIPGACERFRCARGYCFDLPNQKLLVYVGSFIFGIGVYLSGSCPGTTISQLGSRVSSAIPAILGGLLASIVVGLLKPSFNNYKPKQVFDMKANTLDVKFHIPFHYFAFAMSALMFFIVFLIEFFFPTIKDLQQFDGLITMDYHSIWGMLKNEVWPPWICGIIIGTAQIPVILIALNEMGSATGYNVFIVRILDKIWPEYFKKHPYFSGAFGGFESYWQVPYLFAVAVGASFTRVTSESFFPIQGLHPFIAFIGGFISIFGAKTCGGCASGNGLSGMTSLSIRSMIAIGGMFAGGFFAAFVFPLI